uniref:SET domain-containing protein n=2 Tax=Chrysotila carterae TaxID=13221 RepID=A0A7S4BM81_CHRCT
MASELSREDILQQLCQLRDGEAKTWNLQRAPSTIPGAGDGVLLKGSCDSHTVLAVYPGVTFQQDDLPVMHQLVLNGNSYVLARRDGVIIDGRPHGLSLQLFETAFRRDLARTHRANAYPGLTVEDVLSREQALGNMVNHPPAGAAPNVVVVPLDLWEGEAGELSESEILDCSVSFQPPTAGAPCKQTAVLVSRTALCDEELLLDYKLRP